MITSNLGYAHPRSQHLSNNGNVIIIRDAESPYYLALTFGSRQTSLCPFEQFGETTVREDWNGRSQYLRLRVRRLIQVATALVQGGYRDLLG
jgi:hypothetical protein